MIPSAVASEVADALRSFLATGFGPSNPELAGVIDDFLAEPENLVKGPYLSIALPYRHAQEGGEPFPEVPLGYTPYRHGPPPPKPAGRHRARGTRRARRAVRPDLRGASEGRRRGVGPASAVSAGRPASLGARTPPHGVQRPRCCLGAGSHEGAAAEAGDETSTDATAGEIGLSGTRHRLRHSDDLKPDDESIHLPLIQCRECRATGWGAVRKGGEERVDLDLRVFYNRFFARDIDVQCLFPGAAPPAVNDFAGTICGGCGRLTASAENAGKPCAGCGADRVLRVFRPAAIVKKTRGQLSRDCPFCGAVEALIIFGARASSLLSVALGQTFASRHNDDAPHVLAAALAGGSRSSDARRRTRQSRTRSRNSRRNGVACRACCAS